MGLLGQGRETAQDDRGITVQLKRSMRLSQQTDRRRVIGATADPVSKPGALVPHLLLAIGHQFLRHVEVDRLPAASYRSNSAALADT